MFVIVSLNCILTSPREYSKTVISNANHHGFLALLCLPLVLCCLFFLLLFFKILFNSLVLSPMEG